VTAPAQGSAVVSPPEQAGLLLLQLGEPGPLAGAYGATQGSGATQKHVHSIIRTPNGNDYGRELLRQHYLTSPHHR